MKVVKLVKVNNVKTLDDDMVYVYIDPDCVEVVYKIDQEHTQVDMKSGHTHLCRGRTSEVLGEISWHDK
jgi:hypothetical protein